MSAQSFLDRHWQKQPLFMDSALPQLEPALSPDEVAWLATLPDVESRLVFSERHGEHMRYRVCHGPFEETELAALPANNWTLLVQDVEKHLPDFRKQLAWISFLPDWRIDDVMVSVAAPGGSVGPHTDNYDVFLCQGQGNRDWQIATDSATEIDVDAENLALLKPFVGDQHYSASPGDVLYLPPGIAHWGIAADLCVTYSLGMRAPSVAELTAGVARLYPDIAADLVAAKASDAQVFYADRDLQEHESLPGLISQRAVERLGGLSPWTGKLDSRQLAVLLGSVVTDPKAWLAPEGLSPEETKTWLTHDFRLAGERVRAVSGMARIAFHETDTFNLFFANGFCTEISHAELSIAHSVCRDRFVENHVFAAAVSSAEIEAFLTWLAEHGVFDTSEY